MTKCQLLNFQFRLNDVKRKGQFVRTPITDTSLARNHSNITSPSILLDKCFVSLFFVADFHVGKILVSSFLFRKIQLFSPLINSFVSFAPFMSSNEISVTNSQWYFYSVFPLWKRQTNLISCHFKTLTSKKCLIQFHTQRLWHALHILSSKTNAIRILNQIKPKWQLRGERVQTQDLDFWCFYPRLASSPEIKPWVGWVWK